MLMPMPLHNDDGSASDSLPRPDLQKPGHRDMASTLMELPVEIRLQICFEAVKSARPFLIGRCQDETRRKVNGSPRDMFPGPHSHKYDVKRNDESNRPVQPSITRVCMQLRNEALPLFYAENDFWLIHNEYPDNDGDFDEDDCEPRRFRPIKIRNFSLWIAQTPSKKIDLMQHVTLCGYFGIPRRIMIELNVKHRSVGAIRWYTTFGDELPGRNFQKTTEEIRAALSDSAHPSGLDALKAALVAADIIWDISSHRIFARPFARTDGGRIPKEGWDYDW
jgi:hypothetical protein